MKRKRMAKLIAVLCLAALFAFESESASAQVFGMKGGVTIGSVTTREVDSINPMLNYYFEAYYACRFQRYKYWTVGIGYFGTVALSYRVPLGAIDFGYTYYYMQTKFHNYNEDDCYAPQHNIFVRFNINNFSFLNKK